MRVDCVGCGESRGMRKRRGTLTSGLQLSRYGHVQYYVDFGIEDRTAQEARLGSVGRLVFCRCGGKGVPVLVKVNGHVHCGGYRSLICCSSIRGSHLLSRRDSLHIIVKCFHCPCPVDLCSQCSRYQVRKTLAHDAKYNYFTKPASRLMLQH